MRLRKIKPGMNIHCNTKEEWCKLKDALKAEGYCGCDYIVTLGNNCYVRIKKNKSHVWGYITTEKCIEFSDLIIPELSAEEVLRICNDICAGIGCGECPMRGNCYSSGSADYKKVIEICEQWKADHEKKEPELEWVNVCRIIQVQDNGAKKCVYETDITGLNEHAPYSAVEDKTEEILKRYMYMYDGNYIAVVERVCRVKK